MRILCQNVNFYFSKHSDEEPIKDLKLENEMTLKEIAIKEEGTSAYIIKIIHLSNEVSFNQKAIICIDFIF